MHLGGLFERAEQARTRADGLQLHKNVQSVFEKEVKLLHCDV